ncbi:integrase catalytic domain-containing protein [Trichonephila clavipes]|nr:integrase catalytic domain-containing protein [Trichonephila clavipes]
MKQKQQTKNKHSGSARARSDQRPMDKQNRLKSTLEGKISRIETFIESANEETDSVEIKVKLRTVIALQKNAEELRNNYYAIPNVKDEELTAVDEDLHLLEVIREGLRIRDDPVLHERDQAIEIFKETVEFEKGRHIVQLPFRKSYYKLSDNYPLAKQRFQNLWRRFGHDSELYQQYREIIHDYTEQGIIAEVKTEITDNKLKRPVYYLPHQAVRKDGRLTSKTRIVFDAGTFCSDIEQAFLQICLADQHKDAVRFIWSDDEPCVHKRPKLQVYRFNRVNFGVNSSPFLLAATITHHIKKYKHEFPDTVELLDRNFYVDDLISGGNEFEEALQTSRRAKNIMEAAGMDLRKWITNDANLMEQWKKENFNVHPVHETVSLGANGTKVLGLSWNTNEDYLTTDTKSLLEFVSLDKNTKRFILRVAPLNCVTLPRLELLGALIAARLASKVKKIVNLKRSCLQYHWSDSKIVLFWIKGNKTRWKQFVANRVNEITRLTDPHSWYHCADSTTTVGISPKKGWTSNCSRIHKESEIKLIKHAQRSLFDKKEIPSSISNLFPFVDGEGIVRVGGRLENASVPYLHRHPAILPKGSKLSKLYFNSLHTRLFHVGPQGLLNAVRQKFWPLSGRSIARKTVHQCVTCFKGRPILSSQIMGNLPSKRVKTYRAHLLLLDLIYAVLFSKI